MVVICGKDHPRQILFGGNFETGCFSNRGVIADYLPVVEKPAGTAGYSGQGQCLACFFQEITTFHSL